MQNYNCLFYIYYSLFTGTKIIEIKFKKVINHIIKFLYEKYIYFLFGTNFYIILNFF